LINAHRLCVKIKTWPFPPAANSSLPASFFSGETREGGSLAYLSTACGKPEKTNWCGTRYPAAQDCLGLPSMRSACPSTDGPEFSLPSTQQLVFQRQARQHSCPHVPRQPQFRIHDPPRHPKTTKSQRDRRATLARSSSAIFSPRRFAPLFAPGGH